MADQAPREAIRSLLDGNPPDPSIRDLGPFTADYLSLTEVAPSGRAAVIRRFDELAASNPALAQLMAGSLDPQAGGSGRPRVYTIGDLDRLPPISYIDPRRELPANALTVLYAPTGTGKTYLALDYALFAAEKHGVAYVVGEGLLGMRARVKVWRQYHGLDAPGFRAIEGPVRLLDARTFDALLSSILSCEPVLVVIDPLARFIPGIDENDAGRMGLVVEACENVRRATGAAILLLHHSGKNGEIRGSTALPAAADQVLCLAGSASGLTLKCVKSKDAAAFENRHLRRVHVPTGGLQDDGRPETSCVVVPADGKPRGSETSTSSGVLTSTQGRILKALADPLQAGGARAKKIVDLTQLAQSTVARHLARLVVAGWVAHDRANESYRLTQEGRNRLAEMPDSQ